MADTNATVLRKIEELYNILFEHDGFGELTIEMRILKRQQKEVILRCGCQHRYVVNWKNKNLTADSRQTDTNLEQNVGVRPEAHEIHPCSECSEEEPVRKC